MECGSLMLQLSPSSTPGWNVSILLRYTQVYTKDFLQALAQCRSIPYLLSCLGEF